MKTQFTRCTKSKHKAQKKVGDFDYMLHKTYRVFCVEKMDCRSFSTKWSYIKQEKIPKVLLLDETS